jgi:tetratricopeptide (TPR) repeat protein
MKKNKQTFFSWHGTNKTMFVWLAFLPAFTYAQKEKKFILEGNEQFENKKYEEAEKNYQKALKENKDSYKASFNLGDAYYKQEKYEEAAKQFQELTHRATSKDTLAKTYHNLGNALLKAKKYEESATAFKNALKNNPNDDDTRYNLAYAQEFLKQQQQNKDNKDNKDKKDDNKKNKDNKDQKDKDNKDKDKNNNNEKDKEENKKQDEKEKEKQQQQQNSISKENAQRLLDALQNDEKNIQNKTKKNKQGVKVDIQKDW